MKRARIATVALIGALIGNLSGQATDSPNVAQYTTTFDSIPWQKIIEKHLVPPKSLGTASDAEFLAALSRAIREDEKNATDLVRAARLARPGLIFEIQRAGFRALSGCAERAKILFVLRLAEPKKASQLLDKATRLAPQCADSFDMKSRDAKATMKIESKETAPAPGGVPPLSFGNPPGINPNSFGNPPGLSSQGGLVAVCHNGQTIFLTPDRAQQDLRQNPGDRIGACEVTPASNR